jgi:hypothetical protein
MELTERQKWALYQLVSGVREKKLTKQTLGGFAGTGKAQPLHSLIATPKGFVAMGDIKTGDEICTPSGRIAHVSGIYPQGIKAIYRVWFSDGHSVECCDDHLWKVIDRRRLSNLAKYKTAHKIYPLSYIREFLNRKDGRNRFYIETSEPVEFQAQKVAIDPYLMGVLLGDGSIGSNNFAIHNEDLFIIGLCNEALKEWACHLDYKEGVTYNIVGDQGHGRKSDSILLRNELRDLGLWDTVSETKFIPSSYLQNSKSVRLAVLQGLMDTDGTVDERTGMASLTTTSARLAADVCFLVESLGGICRISPKKPKCRYKGEIVLGQDAFVLNIGLNETPNLFRLLRKQMLAKKRSKYKTRRCIRAVEYVGHEQAQCIMVDDPDHLYLTDHFIPTHNTTLIKYLIKFFPTFGVAAYTGKAANVLRKKDIRATTIHSRIYKPFFDNGVVYFDLNPDPGCEGFIIDEASMVTSEIGQDLTAYGMPIIYVGDHGQLEPVDSDFNLMEKPDYTLEEIHRNAGDIAKFAEHLRKGYSSRGFKCQDGSVEFLPVSSSLTDDDLLSTDQIICAFNKTRTETNKRIREIKGLKEVIQIGERVMCLRNNKQAGLFNGMQGTVINLYTGRYGKKYMDFQFDETVIKDVWYDQSCFGQESYKFKSGKDTPNPFDYAYCITAHKAQGDEWESVLVLEQKCKNWQHKRWAYTAASRPKVKLKWKPSPY